MSEAVRAKVWEASQSGDRLVRFSEACQVLGLSKATMYRHLQKGSLPGPVKIGALTFFSERELQGWIKAKLASRDQTLAASAADSETEETNDVH